MTIRSTSISLESCSVSSVRSRPMSARSSASWPRSWRSDAARRRRREGAATRATLLPRATASAARSPRRSDTRATSSRRPGERGDVAAQRVELVAHRVLGLAAQLVLQLQLVLAPGGDLALELALVGPAQLASRAAAAATRSVPRRPAAKVASDERPGHGDDGQPEVLRVVGEERPRAVAATASAKPPTSVSGAGDRGGVRTAEATSSSSRRGMAPA